MNYSFAFFTTVFSFLGYVVMAQDELGLVFPDQKNWNVIEEGQPIKFTLNAKGGLSKN